MLVTINFPPNGAINTLIAQKYAHFYKNRAKRIRSPRARAILRVQLSSEAATVASFHGQQVTYETEVRGSSYNPWKAHKWLVTKYRHWYFAGVIKKTKKGGYIFNVKDALYEGDYHNSLIPLCEGKTIILKESDLRIMVKESIRRIMNEYKDNPIFGWSHVERTRRAAGASDEQIELLRQSYDEFGKEKALRGEIPNDTGFDIWCSKKDAESCENGKGMRYPDYRG